MLQNLESNLWGCTRQITIGYLKNFRWLSQSSQFQNLQDTVYLEIAGLHFNASPTRLHHRIGFLYQVYLFNLRVR
jgi:hypothetical protein